MNKRRVHIFTDRPPPHAHKLTVCEIDGTIIAQCKRVLLKGTWTLRQYNNPVPCGATVVLFPDGDDAEWEVIK